MEIAFIILLLLAHEALYMVAFNETNGITYHISNMWLVWVLRIFLLVVSGWYLGIIVGLIVNVLGFFSIIHATIGWVFQIPILFAKDEKDIKNIGELYNTLVLFFIPITLIFTVVSFFTTKYKCLLNYITDNNLVFTILIILLIGCIIRYFIGKHYNNKSIRDEDKKIEFPSFWLTFTLVFCIHTIRTFGDDIIFTAIASIVSLASLIIFIVKVIKYNESKRD